MLKISIAFVFAFVAIKISSAFHIGRILRRNKISFQMAAGNHGQGFKFMPLIQGNDEEHFPRIMQIAGVYPKLTPEDLLAPVSTPSVPIGTWSYDFSDPGGPQLGTFAMPGSDAVADCIDPVVVIAKNTDLNINASEEVEMVLVIDRADREHTSSDFFIFRTPQNTLKVQWMDQLEDGWEVMGRIALGAIPWTPSSGKKSSGFLEDD